MPDPLRTMPTAPPLSIGSDVWPGVAKLIEECGELQQVLGKLAAYPTGDHPDGAGDVRSRLIEEMGDVIAAATFVAVANGLDRGAIACRAEVKLDRFKGWHDAERPSPSTATQQTGS